MTEVSYSAIITIEDTMEKDSFEACIRCHTEENRKDFLKAFLLLHDIELQDSDFINGIATYINDRLTIIVRIQKVTVER